MGDLRTPKTVFRWQTAGLRRRDCPKTPYARRMGQVSVVLTPSFNPNRRMYWWLQDTTDLGSKVIQYI